LDFMASEMKKKKVFFHCVQREVLKTWSTPGVSVIVTDE